MKKYGSKGFAIVPGLLVFMVLGLVAGTGMYVLNVNRQTNPVTSQSTASDVDADKKQPEAAVSDQDALRKASQSTPPSGSSCSNGRIIVYFADTTSEVDQQAIISAEKVTIKAKLDQFNGYILNVPIGGEATKAVVFANYPEVKSAAPESCPEPANNTDVPN
jgi:hypothetical protein